MQLFLEIAYYSLKNLLYTLKSPIFLMVVLIIFMQYRKIEKVETRLYNTLVSTAFGLLGGVIASIIFIFMGTTINTEDFYFLMPLAIGLSLIHPRFICFSYAGGILALSNLIIGYPDINIPGILMIVGVLHLIESLLILLDGSTWKTPVFMEREGEIVGGFTLNRFWPVPFIIFVNGQIIYPATIVAILGYGDYALANYPEKKSRETAGILSIFSIILIIFAKLSMNYEIFKYIGAIFSPLGHEIVIKIGQKIEENGKYLFKPSPQGLKILDVLPGGIGKKLNLESGDIIVSLNGSKIYSDRDVEAILNYNPNYIWMDILNREKEIITKEFKDSKNGINTLGLLTVGGIDEYQFIVREKESFINRMIDKFRKRKARFKN
ncbi:MAG: PDZ domain-containing protein [Tissierellia bacterium]|nr:PDZ domain-containing protein [Tissierellia bacterium]